MQDRHFALLLGRCMEETAVLRLEPHSSAQGDFSVSGGVTGRSLSCKVRHCLADDTPHVTAPFTSSLPGLRVWLSHWASQCYARSCMRLMASKPYCMSQPLPSNMVSDR